MTYPASYPPERHRAALGDMLRDMQTVIVTPCPECGEPMDYQGQTVEEEEVWGAIQRWTLAGGWCCPECGKFIADEEVDDAD